MLVLMKDYLLIVAFGIIAALSHYAWRHRQIRGGQAFFWLTVAVSEWVLTYGLELAAGTLADKLLWAKLQYVGIALTPVAWFVLAHTYAQPNTPLRRRTLALLLVMPAITMALAASSSWHGLIWRSARLVDADGIAMLQLDHGLWFAAHALFSYILMGLGSLHLLVSALRSPGLMRWQAGSMVGAACAPWFANILYIAKIEPFYPFDLTPFVFGLSAVVLGWSLVRLKLLDLMPISHDTILRSLDDGVIALDTQRRVAHANLAAATLLGIPARAMVGRSLDDLLGAAHPLAAASARIVAGRAEISLERAGQAGIYDLQVLPLTQRDKTPGGWLLIVHDISERKRREQLQRVFAEITQQLASTQEAEVALRKAARALVPALADICVVQLIEPDRSIRLLVQEVANPGKHDLMMQLGSDYPLAPGEQLTPYFTALYGGSPVLAGQVSHDNLADFAHDGQHLAMLKELGLFSLLQLPLVAQGEVLGACLFATMESQRVYTAADRDLAQEVANSMAMAIANARLFTNLQASEQRYRAVVGQAADAILLASATGTIINTNERASALLGASRDTLLRRNIADFVGHFARPDIALTQSLLALNGQVLAAQRADAGFVPVEASVSSFVERGEPLYVVILRDISERISAERQLRRQNDELLALHDTTLGLLERFELSALLEAIVTRAGALLDTPHGYLYMHDPASDTLEVKVATGVFAQRSGDQIKRGEGLAGRVWASGETMTIDNYREWPHRLPALDALNLRAIVNVPIRTRSSFIGVLGLAYQDSMRRPSPAEITLLQRFSRLVSLALDNAQLYTAAQQELAERRRTEAALRTAESELRQAKEVAEAATEAKSAFLAHMSHELRTPLTSLAGNTDLLLTTNLDADQREFANIIRISSNALLDVINDILDLSKIESGKMRVEHQSFDLRDCLEEAIDIVGSQATRKHLDLAYTIDPATPAAIESDSMRLRQVLVNLLSNAVKFTPSGGVSMHVGAQQIEPGCYELQFSVADSGMGIPPERMSRLFTSFDQGDRSIARRYGGTGLGLNISKQLVDLMGGRMWAESEPGKGATFHFTIRARRAESTAAAPAGLAGLRLLVVEEFARTRAALEAQARAWGLAVSATHSALEALRWVRAGAEFDAAILDWQNADMSAPLLIEHLRRYRGFAALPIVVLAAHDTRSDELAAIEPLVQGVLRKPLKLSQLGTTLQSALHHERAVGDAPGLAGNPPALRALVVEDDSVTQQLSARMLQQLGFQARVAENGQQALDLLARERYDAVLLDYNLADMPGAELARQIAARSPAGKRPYLVALSAHSHDELRVLFSNAPIDAFLAKPVPLAALRSTLAKVAPLQHGDGAPDLPARADEPAPAAARPIDHAMLDQTFAVFGDAAANTIRHIVTRFLDDAQLAASAIHAAAARGDTGTLQHQAHKLRSSSLMVAATPLAARCDDLERAAIAGQPADWGALAQRIDDELGRVRPVLLRYSER